jgi:hypothetical protein
MRLTALSASSDAHLRRPRKLPLQAPWCISGMTGLTGVNGELRPVRGAQLTSGYAAHVSSPLKGLETGFTRFSLFLCPSWPLAPEHIADIHSRYLAESWSALVRPGYKG